MQKLKNRLLLFVIGPVTRMTVMGFIVILNVIHPIIHGTPFDSGTVDVMIPQLNAIAASLSTK